MSNAMLMQQQIGPSERRMYPRVRTAVRVEFLPEGTTSTAHAVTSNISCSGCYIETKCTLPVGIRLAMTLWLGEEKLISRGIVTTHHPSHGNGIQFLDISVNDLNRLNRFLHSAIR